MRLRCYDTKNNQYADYGGRGITVCDAWRHDFAAFRDAVGLRPSPTHTLDRRDNNGDYEPGNVRWATRSEQNRNRRNNRLITWRGETLCMAAWAERVGVDQHVIKIRLRNGWSIEDALTTSVSDGIGENNPRAKVSAAAVRAMRAEYAAGGVSQRALGERYGISQGVVSKIVHGKVWTHVGQ